MMRQMIAAVMPKVAGHLLHCIPDQAPEKSTEVTISTNSKAIYV